ncbi:MAG: tripartite tricarboxylate transporter substrate binding protein [Rhizobiales bacterium]|nr:tripartite tricarboxylate transporter substrate binding protein [Hyphomicrobiales bacterium]
MTSTLPVCQNATNNNREEFMRAFSRRTIVLVAAASFASVTLPAVAQDYPKKTTIRVIVPQAVGSATDTVARILAQRISANLGQQMIVDNRPGAGGLLGGELAAKAPPDGYTLILANISSHGVNPALYAKLPYDPVNGFTPIGRAGQTSNLLIVNSGLPFKTLKDIADYAKAHPGKLFYASPGQGSSQHLAVELLRSVAGNINMTHVPYKGSGPGVTAVMGGEAQLMMPAAPSALPALKSGKARAVAVSSPKRHPDYPELPTIAETFPGYEVTSWFGLAAPAGTPRPIVDMLNAAMRKVLDDPEATKQLAAAGLEPAVSSPEEFRAYIRSEIDKWTKVARTANVKLN